MQIGSSVGMRYKVSGIKLITLGIINIWRVSLSLPVRNNRKRLTVESVCRAWDVGQAVR